MAAEPDFNTVVPSGASSRYRIPAASAPTLILSASKDERSSARVTYHGPGSLFIRYGGWPYPNPTGTFDQKITSGSTLELPRPAWQGEVWGYFDAGGFAMVTEFGTASQMRNIRFISGTISPDPMVLFY